MNVMERMYDKLLRESVDTIAVQFGFISGRETTYAIIRFSKLQEMYLYKRKKLYFVDLKKAFERVP